jgi:hypothetical protein
LNPSLDIIHFVVIQEWSMDGGETGVRRNDEEEEDDGVGFG